MGMLAVSNAIKPGFLADEAFGSGKEEEGTSTLGLFVQRGGIKDAFEALGKGFEWMANFDYHKDFAEKAAGDVEIITTGLAIPGFLDSFNKLRREVGHSSQSDDPDTSRRIFNHTMTTVNQGSESVMFFEHTNVISLAQRTLNFLKGFFWGSAGLLEGVNFFYQIGKVENLNKRLSEAKHPELKDILHHRIQQKYLVILQAVTTIAMAAIVLTGILFEVILSPEVMLCLGSTWLVLNFSSYFYKQTIAHWKQSLPIGIV